MKSKKVEIFITQQCNLACSYCEAQANKSMNRNISKKIISFLKKDDGKEYNVILEGGEPFLNYPVLKYLVEHIKNIKNKKFSFRILTNLTIWNDDIRNFIQKNKIQIQTSLDGTRRMHDANRKFKDGSGSYEVVVSNLADALKSFPEIEVKMVYSPQYKISYKEFREGINKILKMGVKHLTVIANYKKITDFKETREFDNYLKKFYIEKAKKERKIPPIDNININLKNVIIPTERSKKRYLRSPCDAVTQGVVIGCDGEVYPCLFYFLTGNKNVSLGKVDNIDKNKLALFRQTGIRFLKAYNRRDENIVNGRYKIQMCLSMNYRLTGSSLRFSPAQFKSAEADIKRDLEIYNSLKGYKWFINSLEKTHKKAKQNERE